MRAAWETLTTCGYHLCLSDEITYRDAHVTKTQGVRFMYIRRNDH